VGKFERINNDKGRLRLPVATKITVKGMRGGFLDVTNGGTQQSVGILGKIYCRINRNANHRKMIHQRVAPVLFLPWEEKEQSSFAWLPSKSTSKKGGRNFERCISAR